MKVLVFVLKRIPPERQNSECDGQVMELDLF